MLIPQNIEKIQAALERRKAAKANQVAESVGDLARDPQVSIDAVGDSRGYRRGCTLLPLAVAGLWQSGKSSTPSMNFAKVAAVTAGLLASLRIQL